jgi:Putative transposase, YhgA-like
LVRAPVWGTLWTVSPNVHDALFKIAFSQIEHAVGELRLILPPEIVALLDFATLTLHTGSFVDEALKERSSDLLFSVQLAGRPALIYLLFEHQSRAEELMPFRLLRYEVRIWDDWLKSHPNASRLPPILPLVLHHSEKGWTAPTRFEDVLDVDDETRAVIAEHVPRFQLLLDDISHATDESLQARTMSAFARLVLFCLRHAREPEQIVERLGQWRAIVREVQQAPNGAAALRVIWRYILGTSDRGKSDEFVRRLVAAAGPHVEEEIVTIADQLREEGRQEGRKEGRRTALLKLLRARFGALPETVVARVNGAGAADLEAWFDRALVAQALAEVLGDA